MICPHCGTEFSEGSGHLASCSARQRPEDHSLHEHETILETSATEEILVVKSLLESASIPYRTEGEVMNELFPANTMVTLFNPHYVVAFKVPKEHAEEARDLLSARFDENEDGEMEENAEGAAPDNPIPHDET